MREAQRGDVEAFDVLIEHVGVGVVVQRGQRAGIHDHVLGTVHELEALLLIGLRIDGFDEDVVGVGPGAALDGHVVPEVGKVEVVGRNTLMVALAELRVVIARTGSPHVEHADRIGVVHDPTVTRDGEVSRLAGIEECGPLLVLHGHLDAHGRERGLQVLTDGLV